MKRLQIINYSDLFWPDSDSANHLECMDIVTVECMDQNLTILTKVSIYKTAPGTSNREVIGNFSAKSLERRLASIKQATVDYSD